MKKVILIACVILLIFTGCAVYESPETTAETEQITATQPGIYAPDSAVELQTGGAVRQYALDSNLYSKLFMIGDRLLVAGDENGKAVMKLYSGDRAVEVASIQLSVTVLDAGISTYHNGCAYYLSDTRQFVFLDMQLKETQRVQLPDGIVGKPVLSDNGEQIFYCTNQQIYAVEVQHKITRLVKTHECQKLSLIDSYMNGKVLACHVEYADGKNATLYIASQTGQTLYEYDDVKELYSYEDRFFGRRIDGKVEQVFFGKDGEDMLQINMQGGTFVPALALNAVVRYEKTADGLLQLQLLDLSEGKVTSQIALQNVDAPASVAVNRWRNCIWLLTKDGKGALSLMRWNVKATVSTEETVYTGQFYTASNPNEAGLEECSDRAKKIGKTYGVVIRLWESAVKYHGDFAMVPEHQISVINQCLDELETVLKEFPKKFVDKSISNQIRVCIVRSVDGETKAVRYWNGSSAYIVLSVGCDVRNGFIKGLSYVVDSHVLGNSSRYDYWNEANPVGFSYEDKKTHSEKYLKGDKRAFVDAISMTAVVEDRSAIFYEAMQPDNQEMFQSDAMQEKLYMLCKGVRSAWSLRKNTEIFPWEQYLDDPIAYKK